MSVGLDPCAGRDRWGLYEFFPETRKLDLERYPAAQDIRTRFAEAGFVGCRTQEVEPLERIERASDASAARGDRLRLRADLHLYATSGWKAQHPE